MGKKFKKGVLTSALTLAMGVTALTIPAEQSVLADTNDFSLNVEYAVAYNNTVRLPKVKVESSKLNSTMVEDIKDAVKFYNTKGTLDTSDDEVFTGQKEVGQVENIAFVLDENELEDNTKTALTENSIDLTDYTTLSEADTFRVSKVYIYSTAVDKTVTYFQSSSVAPITPQIDHTFKIDTEGLGEERSFVTVSKNEIDPAFDVNSHYDIKIRKDDVNYAVQQSSLNVGEYSIVLEQDSEQIDGLQGNYVYKSITNDGLKNTQNPTENAKYTVNKKVLNVTFDGYEGLVAGKCSLDDISISVSGAIGDGADELVKTEIMNNLTLTKDGKTVEKIDGAGKYELKLSLGGYGNRYELDNQTLSFSVAPNLTWLYVLIAVVAVLGLGLAIFFVVYSKNKIKKQAIANLTERRQMGSARVNSTVISDLKSGKSTNLSNTVFTDEEIKAEIEKIKQEKKNK